MQTGAFGCRQRVGVAQRGLIVRGRLAMRADRGRLRAGERCPVQHLRGIACANGVMGQPCRGSVGTALSTPSTLACSCWRRGCGSVSSSARRASSCRKAREESSCRTIPTARQPATAASSGCAACSSSHASVLPGTTQTSSASARAAGESRAARASTASRTVAGNGIRSGGENLRHEQRIAAGDAVQVLHRSPDLGCQAGDGRFREGRQRQPGSSRAGQAADDEPQWVRCSPSSSSR